MSVGSRIRNWKVERRRNRTAKRGGKASLREFVYLDEVSVYSLIASRKGTVPSEVTESESALLRGDITSSVGANVGLAKGEVSSSLETQQTNGVQVVRKALVQSTFKELFDLEGPHLSMRAGEIHGTPPDVKDADALLKLARSDSNAWATSMDALRRGTLLELEVELEAEGIFRMSAIMTAFFEILDENPKLLGSASLPNLIEGFMANRILGRLLAGLVPIRGRAVDYRSVKIGSDEVIVHRAVLDGMQDVDLVVQPLFVVGVAERELFWRDIRRVLFSHSRYSVLCRLSRDGTHSSWTPVKLVDVLREVSADLGSSIQEIGGFLDRQRHGESGDGDDQAREAAMRDALVGYAIDFTRQYGHQCSADDLIGWNLPSTSQIDGHASREERREAFNELTGSLEKHFEFQGEPLVAAQLRFAALEGAGFDLEGNLPEVAPTHQSDGPSSDEVPRYLDSNIVAIYW